MNRGLYIGATSMMNNQKRMDVLSNNLANVNTTGFKKDISVSVSFPEKLLAKTSRMPERLTRLDEDNLTYEQKDGVHSAKLKEGYFMLDTPNGKSYVKEIKVVQDDEGYLRTFYKNLNDEYKTDNENYLLDRNGNRVNNINDVEGFLNGNRVVPPRHVIGTMSGGVKFDKSFIDFTGSGVMDGGKLDLAIKGDGFFKFQPLDGETADTLYSRDGSLTVKDGFLTDQSGRRILGTNGPIQITDGEFAVSPDGRVSIDENVVGQLAIVDITNKEFLRKVGDNNYAMAENVQAEEGNFQGEVLQGYLETSNVDPITGMVEMITLLRDYEMAQKAIKMQDEMLEKAATEIGRI